jgi:hypothetical protein
LKGTLKARNLESYLQFNYEQLDWESGDSEEDSYVSAYGAFVGECPSDENLAHRKELGLEIEISQWKKQR